MTYADMDPDAQDEVRERAAIIWEGTYGCDESAWLEAKRLAVACVAMRLDRERRIIYPAHPNAHKRIA